MADYSRFDATIIPWLQKVWDNHEFIEQTVNRTPPDEFPRKEGAWLIYGYYNDPYGWRMNSDDAELNKFHMKLRSLQWFFGIPFSPESSSAQGEIKSNDFFHFRGCGTGPYRVFVNVAKPRSEHWEQVAKHCLRDMTHGRRDIVEFKVAGPGFSTRTDQIVIYLATLASLQPTLDGLQVRCSESIGGEVPPGVKQIAPGLGWSAEPSKDEHGSSKIDEIWVGETHSFGSYLSAVILMALEQSWHRTEDTYVTKLLENFLLLGIDPANPHLLRSLTPEQMKHMASVDNTKVVMAGVTPSTTVFTNMTQRFPLHS